MVFLRSFIFLSTVTCGQFAGAQAADSVPLRCGGHCLYTALKMFSRAPPTYDAFEEETGLPTRAGYSMQQLADACAKYELNCITVQTNAENLVARRERFACIALLEANHFVLLGGFEDGRWQITDPPRSYDLPAATLEGMWSGHALVISNEELEPEELLAARLHRRQLFKRGLYSVALASIALLAVTVVRRIAVRR